MCWELSWFWFWVILAVILFVGEIFTAGFFLLPFSLGAVAAALAAWFGLSLVWQWGIFLLVSVPALLLLKRFADRVTRIPEVVELYRMSGEIDYMLRIVVPDIKAYDAVYKRLIAAVPLFDVSSSFAMEAIKYTTALPVDYAT